MSRSIARPVMALAGLVLTVVVAAACGTGGPPQASPPAVIATSVPSSSAIAGQATPAIQTASPAALDPTPVPTPDTAQPPAAILAGDSMAGEPQVASLGTYTWGDQGSDAPWIVARGGNEVKAGTPLQVSLDPSMTPASWTARWAPVAGDGVGDVASSQDGSGSPSLLAPAATGWWSLQLEAHFGQGHSAVWYWRLEVP
jgi:hypothetical protein